MLYNNKQENTILGITFWSMISHMHTQTHMIQSNQQHYLLQTFCSSLLEHQRKEMHQIFILFCVVLDH
jgi:hypothetical protein